MKIKFTNLYKLIPQKNKINSKIISLIKKSNFIGGDEVKLFEKNFAKFVGAKNCITVGNGTDALEIAIKSLNLKKGSEIIIPNNTWISTAEAVITNGHNVKFCDVNLDDYSICLNDLKKKINKKTKAIIVVHLYGNPANMIQLRKIIKNKKIKVIEDCAQAHGAMFKGRHVGTFGDIGCWSFCQDKIMTTAGEGGMLCTNNKKIWKKVWELKDHGKSYDAVYSKKIKKGFRWLHESFGSNYRMTEIQAAIGRLQLKKLSSWTKKRNKYQNLIWQTANTSNGFIVPNLDDSFNKSNHIKNRSIHAAYKCYIFVDQKQLKKAWSRDKIIDRINEQGVPCLQGSCSEIYLEKAFKKMNLQPKKRLKNAKLLGETSLTFLVHPTLTAKEIEKTCEAIKLVSREAFK